MVAASEPAEAEVTAEPEAEEAAEAEVTEEAEEAEGLLEAEAAAEVDPPSCLRSKAMARRRRVRTKPRARQSALLGPVHTLSRHQHVTCTTHCTLYLVNLPCTTLPPCP